ncbi:MAG TPA: DUF4383 domain-containing protein [Candidatus Paceibacterota bacterium]
MAKKLAKVFGIIFILVGLLGFIGNPVIGEMGFFHSDMIHNLIHIVSGLILLLAAAKGAASMWLKILGIIYLLVAVLGFMMIDSTGMAYVLGIISVNSADNWLHLVLGLIFVWAGMSGKKDLVPMSMNSDMPGQM